MSRVVSARRRKAPPRSRLIDRPLLHSGDRLTRAEFHRRYCAAPDDVKYELIGGLVYMASPVGILHGKYHSLLNLAVGLYSASTPGTEVLIEATHFLSADSEPQPDVSLRIHEEWGGSSRRARENYIAGAPELLAEVAHSSVALDLHQKKDAYERAGVLEYVVVCVAERELHWFDFRSHRRIRADDKGVLRSRAFPGLWIHETALVALDAKRLVTTVRQGLASREHAEFVKRLSPPRRRS